MKRKKDCVDSKVESEDGRSKELRKFKFQGDLWRDVEEERERGGGWLGGRERGGGGLLRERREPQARQL